jgi:hypothetical protein
MGLSLALGACVVSVCHVWTCVCSLLSLSPPPQDRAFRTIDMLGGVLTELGLSLLGNEVIQARIKEEQEAKKAAAAALAAAPAAGTATTGTLTHDVSVSNYSDSDSDVVLDLD